MSGGIIYEYEDGGSYCGEWEGDSSHGFGVCTGPKGQGTFEGNWDHGNQVSGVYRWPSGMKYSGAWQNNLRHGTGVETRQDGTEYSGEFTRGARGPYGVAKLPNGVYQGQWVSGAQDGEGVEMYSDKGCYRGQYKKGLRSGYGTRSSAAYEARGDENELTLTASNSEPSLQAILQSKSETQPAHHSSLRKSVVGISSLQNTESSSSLRSTTSSKPVKEDVAQMYAGEWVNDKRHGHGILKVCSNHTYYGQWANNTRTGYGVVVYENGIKEEGEWHNGKLMVVLKRNKVLLFKTNQLESKVKEARTKALQAADTARNKAELATSRASSAVNKSRSAHQTAQRAQNHAQLAVLRAEAFKNAPRVSEGITSPMAAEMAFPPMDSPPSHASLPSHTHSTSTMSNTSTNSLDSPKMSRLGVTQTVVPSSSFEDIQTIYTDSRVGQGSIEPGQDSPLSSRKSTDYHESLDSISSTDEGLYIRSDDLKQRLRDKRRRLQQYSSSSEQSFERSSPGQVRRRSNTSSPSSGSTRHVSGTRHERGLRRTWSLEEIESDEELGVRRSLRKIDKTTGEVGHGDASDDDLLEKDRRPRLSGDVKPLVKKNTITMDMLNQMAKWNKMVAYINFALLVVLLFLIVIIFASMYYYQLVAYYKNHPDPEEQASPGGFLTPLA